MLQTFDMILCFHRHIFSVRNRTKEGWNFKHHGDMQRHESNCTYLKIITRIERQKTFIMCFWNDSGFVWYECDEMGILYPFRRRISMIYSIWVMRGISRITHWYDGENRISLTLITSAYLCMYLFCMMTDKDWLDIFDIMAHINEIWHFIF